MRSTARLQSKPILCLNSALIIDEAQQRNCLCSSCSLGKCSMVRLSSRLPLSQARQGWGPLPVPPTPGWAGNHQLGLALQSWLLGQRQGCSFPVRAAAPSSTTQQKPLLQPRSEAEAHLRTRPSPRKTSSNNVIPSLLRYFTVCPTR